MTQWGKPYVTERKVTVGGVNQTVRETSVDLVSDDDAEVEFTQVINIEIRTDNAAASNT